MTRLELVRIRICERCGRGNAVLRAPSGQQLVVRLDPGRARELVRGGDDVLSLVDVTLERLAAEGLGPREVVLDLAQGHLRALLSIMRGEEADVIACTPEEGLSLALRGGIKIYATDEALARTPTRTPGMNEPGGTVH